MEPRLNGLQQKTPVFSASARATITCTAKARVSEQIA